MEVVAAVQLSYGFATVVILQAQRAHRVLEFPDKSNHRQPTQKRLIQILNPLLQIPIDINNTLHPKNPIVLPRIEPTTERTTKIEHQVNPSNLIKIKLTSIYHKR